MTLNSLVTPTGSYYDLDFSATTHAFYQVLGVDASLPTYLEAGVLSDGPDFLQVYWDYNIETETILAIHQSSPRVTSGTLSISSIDDNQTIYNTYSHTFTIAGSGTTLGSYLLNGTSYAFTPSTAESIATDIASKTVVGYTITKGTGATVVVTHKSAQIPEATAAFLTLALSGYTVSMAAGVGVGSAIDNPNYNTLTFGYSELSYPGSTYALASKTYSTNINNVDAFGSSRYIDTQLEGNSFLRAISYKQIYDAVDVSWSVATRTLTGTRAVTSSLFTSGLLGTVLQTGWDQASDAAYQEVELFMEPECVSSLTSTLSSLRTASLIFSTFITGLKVSNGVSVSSSEALAATNAIIDARAGVPSTIGLAYYCNEFMVRENYSGTTYWSIPIGSIGAMLGYIMEQRNGGAAPMFINENGMGGQIGKAVTRQKYSFDATNLDMLDAAGVNPLIRDDLYGLMITSQKTAQSPAVLDDYSFLGHTMAFDLLRQEIRSSVMLPQIGKLIDAYHMKLRREQATIILNQRLTGSKKIWDSGIVIVEEVNTAATKAQNDFYIKIRVKVNPFAEYVTLNFGPVGQSDTVG